MVEQNVWSEKMFGQVGGGKSKKIVVGKILGSEEEIFFWNIFLGGSKFVLVRNFVWVRKEQ